MNAIYENPHACNHIHIHLYINPNTPAKIHTHTQAKMQVANNSVQNNC